MTVTKRPFETTTMALYLQKQIETLAGLGINQRDIASDAGYPLPNIVSMFKRGETKVPLNKVTSLAKALKVDPAFFFRLACQQPDMPLTTDDIDKIFPHNVTAREMGLIRVIREALVEAGVEDPAFDERQAKAIADTVISTVADKKVGVSVNRKQL